MAGLRRCPGRGALRRFLLGQTPEREAERLELHLARCPFCLQIAGSLHPRDALAEAVRAGLRAAEWPAGEGDDRLIEQLCRLRPNRLGTPEQCGAAETPPDPPSAATPGPPFEPSGAAPEWATWLAPAERPDELGRLGPYRVLRFLGAGGMGIVFEAEDPHLQRRVALKVMRPVLVADGSARRRFLREARAIAALKHDHIVTIHQVAQARGLPFFAMEFLTGETLEDRLRRTGRPGVAATLRIGREIATGLAAAHRRGLVHRDIKPANLWLEADTDRVKILDFGLALTADDAEPLTHYGAVLGTPGYMAPEQATGQSADARCDLFSLGVVLYRLCAGRLPFAVNGGAGAPPAGDDSRPRPPHVVCPDVPPALSLLVMRLLARSAADRPPTADAVAANLQALADGRPGPTWLAASDAADPAPLVQSAPPRRRWVGAWITLAAALLSAGALLAAVLSPKTDKGRFILEADGQTGATTRRAALEVWADQVVGLPAEKQVQAVASKMQELNPGFDGTVIPTLDRGEVVGLQLFTDKVTNLEPVRACPRLRRLICRGTGRGASRLCDLWPLRGLPLTFLDCSGSHVTDLAPLRRMPLQVLVCWGTPLRDLAPLQGLPLTYLDCRSTCVADLEPLRNMGLTHLLLTGTPVTDLTPLRGSPLREFSGPVPSENARETLHSIQTLEKINDRPAARFWKKADAKARPGPP
ncbi:MAG TPA: protein kinase [Gemmataceae bacterium]|nr:protein kinase [Gemmataceae bacterium]